MRFKLSALALLIVLSGCSSMDKAVPDAAEPSVAAVDLATDAATATQNPLQSQNPSPLTPTQQAQYQKAIALMETKDWSAARTAFEFLMQQQPLSSTAYHLGIIALNEQQSAQALEYFNKALELNSNNYYAHNQLAIIKRQQGEFTQAEKHLQQALSIWPEFASAHYNIGILYELYMGKLAEALSHYQKYQELVETGDRKVTMWIADLSRRVEALQ